MAIPNPSADAEDESPHRSYARPFFKGCGCLAASAVLAIGVAVAGQGEISSWGSALIGVLFLILVVGTSGVNGWWSKDD